jgi:Fur family ferric uptake transcriptional regulator
MRRRNTASQAAVERIFTDSGTALSQEMVEERLEGRFDRSTVYRILNRFVSDGKLHRIVGSDGKQYFASCSDCGVDHRHDHLHFRCLNCERVECLPHPLELRLPEGYRPEEINATVAGYCAACAAD